MAFTKIAVIAFRDLGRNRRRTLLTLLAFGLGLALLIMLSAFMAGVLNSSIQDGIRLKTGHIQIRNQEYDEKKMSLLWGDLLTDLDTLLARAQATPGVKAAAPVLWSNGILSTIHDSTGMQVYGIQPDSALYDPIRDALVEGTFVTGDDRDGVLIGRRLARNMNITVGDKVDLLVSTSDGQPDQGVFVVRGLFDTGVFSYDESSVFMPLSKAQAFTGAGDRASAVLILLNDDADDEVSTQAVADALQTPGLTLLTWMAMNAILVQTFQSASAFYVLMYGIVMLVVAVLIANTLLMAVFERTREIGVLSALGMKGRQILLMIFLEAVVLSVLGIVIGVGLGSLFTLYLSNTGINLGEATASVGNSITYASVMYPELRAADVVGLSVTMAVIVLLASLYPAWFASRLQPVEALHKV